MRMKCERMSDEEFAIIFQEHKSAVYQFAWRTGNPVLPGRRDTECFLGLVRGGYQSGSHTITAAGRGIGRSGL